VFCKITQKYIIGTIFINDERGIANRRPTLFIHRRDAKAAEPLEEFFKDPF
jgi:hypothetical protein